MGNRGKLHNEANEIVVPWRGKRWITCALNFKGRRRKVFGPGSYSELFFLDEATSFSAGHRPCAECRRDRFQEFRLAWIAANPGVVDPAAGVDEVDRVLHSERAIRGGGKRSFEAEIRALPSSTFIEYQGKAHMVWGGGILPWSFGGYGRPISFPKGVHQVRVLTPASIVRLLEAGFQPQVHESAGLVNASLRTTIRSTPPDADQGK